MIRAAKSMSLSSNWSDCDLPFSIGRITQIRDQKMREAPPQMTDEHRTLNIDNFCSACGQLARSDLRVKSRPSPGRAKDSLQDSVSPARVTTGLRPRLV